MYVITKRKFTLRTSKGQVLQLILQDKDILRNEFRFACFQFLYLLDSIPSISSYLEWQLMVLYHRVFLPWLYAHLYFEFMSNRRNSLNLNVFSHLHHLPITSDMDLHSDLLLLIQIITHFIFEIQFKVIYLQRFNPVH